MSSEDVPPRPELTRPPDLASILHRNIGALHARRRREAAAESREMRIARVVTDFAGSMRFVYLHLAIFVVWVAVNLGWVPGAPRFDPTFVILAMVASVEAIFLSTFVLITQNRMMADAERRNELDLQINLLAEHEITRIIALVTDIAEKLGVESARDPELRELSRDVIPEAVLDEITSEQAHDHDGAGRPPGSRPKP
jgi:uncharacterized membrane protein